MKVSQLTYVMGKSGRISVHSGEGAIVFDGFVREMKKDNPVNKMYVTSVFAHGGIIYVRAVEPINKRGGRK
jgi:hypothetical protein